MKLLQRAAMMAVAVFFVSTLAFATEAQNPPPSLERSFSALYLADGGTLTPTQPTAARRCAPILTPPETAAKTQDYSLTVPDVHNGGYIKDDITVDLDFVHGSIDNQPTGTTPSGLVVRGTITFGTASITAWDNKTTQTVDSARLSFPISARLLNDTGHVPSLRLTVEIRPDNAGPERNQPPLPASIGLNCGPNSKTGAVKYIIGRVGDGDLDGDSVPDSSDTDIDGDNVTNAQENVQCTLANGERRDFSRDANLRPRNNDADKDGWNDDVECARGFDPLSQSSFPTKPKTFVDYLMDWLFLIILVIVVAALVFFYLKFAKSALVTVVSNSSLFIPPGQKAKYEVGVENLAKKGEPRTFQLVVEGMPEGWDAKLNVDHVTLDPQSGAKPRETVWLEVEAPDHKEPESAVVAVKAIALNAAGRKDPLRRPAKAKTITSINVPPGSKVPVKRGGVIKPAEPATETPGEPAVLALKAAERPVVDIEGIGPTYAEKLEQRGITTIGQLRDADAAALADEIDVAPETVRQWQQMGWLMEIEGIGPQYSEQLVRAGITSVPQLAQSKPKVVVAAVDKANEGRQVPIQGNVITEKVAKHWVKAAAKSPLAKGGPSAAAPAIAPAPPVEAVPEPAPAPAPKKGKKGKAAEAAPAPEPAATPAPAPAAAKPSIQVGGLKHEPPAFRQGETVKSTVNVSNGGKAPSTLKLSLFVNDGLADVQTVTVKPGKAKDVQFKWTAQERNKLNIRGELVPG